MLRVSIIFGDLMVVEQLSYDDVKNMMLCLHLKIEQHPELRDLLLETGKRIIIEDVTSRRDKGSALFWGAALESEDGSWTGKNFLGECWMTVRSEVRNEFCS